MKQPGSIQWKTRFSDAAFAFSILAIGFCLGWGALSVAPRATLADTAYDANLQTRDDAPFFKARTMTVGTAYPPGRAIAINATVAGNVILDLADGTSTITVPVQTGFTQLPFSVSKVESGSTATATYSVLY